VNDDARVLRPVRWVLRLGVGASVALVLLGVAISFARHPSYLVSAGQLAILKSPGGARVAEGGILLAALHLQGQALVLSGLMILMVTPLAGVLAALVSFAVSRRWAFSLIGVVVLGLLLLSALLGRAGG
jgi:uncharacterized membrane protein